MNVWRAARKAIVASAIVVGVLAANAATAWGDPAGVGTVAWLSAGDSYSSGEGIAGTGVGTDTCAQSTLAYGPRAAELLARQRGWTITPSRFVACTGAKIGDYFGGAATANSGRGPQWTQAVERDATRRFDVITLSLGGNDIRFADTLITCIDTPLTTDSWTGIVLGKKVGDGPCAPSLDDIKARIDALARGSFQQPEGAYPSSGPMTLADFYVKVAIDGLTKRGLLVVAGYPRLFAPTSAWGQWRHGRCQLVKAADADMLGQAAEYLDQVIRKAVTMAAQRLAAGSIVYTSRYELFHEQGESHELCSGRTEYVNGFSLGLRDNSGRLAHSFHINDIGHQVTAERIAGEVERKLAPPATPTAAATPTAPQPTTAPVVTDGTSHWGVGDAFRASCVVAWPTAPVRTRQYIQMRMSCVGVPDQYLFVDVIYGDPNLAVTPSTGAMIVEGRIIDIATSEFGFRTLVVQASRVTLPH